MAREKLSPTLDFLYCFVVSGIYDLVDGYLFGPLIYLGVLPRDPLFVHRSITHTVWFLLGLSIVALALFGKEYFRLTFLIGLISHFVPDVFAGEVQILKPLSYYGFSSPQVPLMAGVVCGIISLILLWKDIRSKQVTRHPKHGFLRVGNLGSRDGDSELVSPRRPWRTVA